MSEEKKMKIRLESVSKEFSGSEKHLSALQNISLNVRDGEFLSIVGPSGCGKTTLLNIIAGLTKPDSGKVIINDKEVSGPGPDKVFMFQESALFPWLSVIENIEFGLKMKGMPKNEREVQSLKYLKMVRLARFKDSFVHELSGGMKQRVALARALVMEPDILLMDEPFAALDAQTRDGFHHELQEIWMKTKKTIIFVTHNVSEAVCLGDRVVILTFRPGRVKKEFLINYPRPRHYRDSPELANTTAKVLDELKDEVDKAAQEEFR